MMESISSEKIPLIQHTLDKLYLAIEKLQERTASIHTVDDFLTTPGAHDTLRAFKKTKENIKNRKKHLEGTLH